MKIAILTKEYPPYVYGGAGVHVDYLSRALSGLDHGSHEINVFCFGDQNQEAGNLEVRGIESYRPGNARHPGDETLSDTLVRDIAMVAAVRGADVIHCHTWYTHLAGCLLRETLSAPLVLTTHSLEPHRPWKKEQLGAGYRASCWLEKTAYHSADGVIAVSGTMKEETHRLYGVPGDRIRVIHNGVDTDRYRFRPDPRVLADYGIDRERPYVLMVSRITRQKGIRYFLEALKYLPQGTQGVLCASSPDTGGLMQEVSTWVRRVKEETGHDLIWISRTVPVDDLTAIYSQAAVFVCPSIYEPFGIINLEAMACSTPVVASAVGGIPEIVMDGETGRLVAFDAAGPDDPEPRDPVRFASDLARAVGELLADPVRRKQMGERSRNRVVEHFSWQAVARATIGFYRECIERFRVSNVGCRQT